MRKIKFTINKIKYLIYKYCLNCIGCEICGINLLTGKYIYEKTTEIKKCTQCNGNTNQSYGLINLDTKMKLIDVNTIKEYMDSVDKKWF